VDQLKSRDWGRRSSGRRCGSLRRAGRPQRFHARNRAAIAARGLRRRSGDSSELSFEKAGPREHIYFNPHETVAAIVTCGGLCPGLNNVIRSVFLQLHHNYGVKNVLGIRYGYCGLSPAHPAPPVRLTEEYVESIHKLGARCSARRGSRGAVRHRGLPGEQRINLLFPVGGDGTQRGAHAIAVEAQRRGLPLSVVGIPKTIDNDCPTSGSRSATRQRWRKPRSAGLRPRGSQGRPQRHQPGETDGALFRLHRRGRHPRQPGGELHPGAEVPFRLEGQGGFLAVLKRRILARRHAVIVPRRERGRT